MFSWISKLKAMLVTQRPMCPMVNGSCQVGVSSHEADCNINIPRPQMLLGPKDSPSLLPKVALWSPHYLRPELLELFKGFGSFWCRILEKALSSCLLANPECLLQSTFSHQHFHHFVCCTQQKLFYCFHQYFPKDASLSMALRHSESFLLYF